MAAVIAAATILIAACDSDGGDDEGSPTSSPAASTPTAVAALPSKPTDLADYPAISSADLATILVPSYIQEVPELDGWESPYEYYLNVANPLAQQVMAIRSPGRDGRFSSDAYTVGSFDPESSDEDIVWADGFFVRWPQKK